MKKKSLNPILYLFPSIISCFLLVQCKNADGEKIERKHIVRDTTINQSNAFSEIELDSTSLETYISKQSLDESDAERLRNFYDGRNYHFAWFTEDGLAEQARAFWHLHGSYAESTGDSSIYDKKLHNLMAELINDAEATSLTPTDITEAELNLTNHFFKYAAIAYEGKVDPSDLQWHIPRKKINPVALLDSLVNTKGKQLDAWEPVNANYTRLKNELSKYHAIEKQGGWPTIEMEEKVLEPGDSSGAIIALKNRLSMTGDYTDTDKSPIYNDALEVAVKRAQKRFGLQTDGVVGPATLSVLNEPVSKRIKQMLVNLERMKWMPQRGEGTRLVANIPAFKLFVYEGDNLAFDMKIVVGKAGTSSVIFSDKLEYVVFSPYWNIPASIVRNEILPSMRRNPGYLARNNMEQTGTRNGLPVVRQLPGGSNSLGRVKFIFPNNYNIYFHDTPAKHLFGRNDRAFSHGCIRLEQPQRLAEYLLRNNDNWNTSSISNAMHSNKEKWVKLEEKVPVLIAYFTAWVDDSGTVNFRDDIYGHDKKLMSHLFEN